MKRHYSGLTGDITMKSERTTDHRDYNRKGSKPIALTRDTGSFFGDIRECTTTALYSEPVS
jgi:hypothetical protein